MSELIDRQAALDVLCDACGNCACPKGKIPRCSYYEKMQAIPADSPWHRVEEPPKEEGRYWCATKFAGHWIFYAAWYWNNVSDYTGVPVGKEEKADGFVLGEDVVYPDYWMPIEPPKEDKP